MYVRHAGQWRGAGDSNMDTTSTMKYSVRDVAWGPPPKSGARHDQIFENRALTRRLFPDERVIRRKNGTEPRVIVEASGNGLDKAHSKPQISLRRLFGRLQGAALPGRAGARQQRARSVSQLTQGGWPRARASVGRTSALASRTGISTTGISPRSTTSVPLTTRRRVGGAGGRGGAGSPTNARAGG